MNFNKELFLKEAVKEYIRWTNIKKKAHYEARRSKAKINVNKFSKKYNLSSEGYSFLDMFFGNIIMQTFGDAFNTDETILFEKAEKAFIATSSLLENELTLQTN